MAIHPTAVVDASAEIADGVEIGPWSTVGPGVRLETGVSLVSHVVVVRDTMVGEGTAIHPFAVIGGDPQHTGYAGERVTLEIGARNVIREHATFNRGTPQGTGVTRVGSDGFFMTGAHVGHDCVVGDRVVMANNATLGGHVHVGDRVFIGGLAAVHQNARIGRGAMLGGVSGVTRDVIPYGSVWGDRARLHGLNLVGLKRNGLDKSRLRRLLAAYRALFEGEGVFDDRVTRAEAEAGDVAEMAEILAFIRAGGKRPLCLPDAE